MMDFPNAMREVIKGNAIRRDSWEDQETYCELSEGILVINQDTGMNTWIISISDMMADDWIIAGELLEEE